MRSDTYRLRNRIDSVLESKGKPSLESFVLSLRPQSWEKIARKVNSYLYGSGVSVSSQSLINWFKHSEKQ